MTLAARLMILATLALGITVAGCGRSDLFSARGHHAGAGGSGAGADAGSDGGASGADGGSDAPVPCQARPEICGNNQDDNCNNLADCKDPGCFGDRSCTQVGVEICNNGLDDDDDGRVDCADPDCNGNPACRPVMGMEICDNQRDDNGDGLVDCGDPQCKTFPACLAVRCLVDVDFGALAVHGAKATRTMTTVGATATYATCAPAGGHGVVGQFSVDQVSDVRLDFSQPMGAAHAVALFRAGVNQACDQNPVYCLAAGQMPSATHTFAGLAPGVYRVIVESFSGTPGATTVTLSTGDITQGMEICNNGVDDDKNGLIDCQDSACLSAPACAGSECVTDDNVGTLVVGAMPKPVAFSTTGGPNRYHPICAGMSTGGDHTVAFTLAEAGGVNVVFNQSGDHTFGFYRLPPAGSACDAQPVTCFNPDTQSGAFALSDQAAGRYILTTKALSPAQAGFVSLRLSAFSNRKVETCNNGIDDDGNGLTDCDDPACFGVGSCVASACNPSQNLGSISWGTSETTVVDTRGAPNLYQTTCGRGDGREQVLRITLTQPMALGLQCMDGGSHVFQLARQVNPLDACNANSFNCGDPAVIPFGCSYAVPNLQPGTYNLIVEAFQSGDEGLVNLTLTGIQETVREICDNGIDDDKDGATDCADVKCVAEPTCAQFACRPDVKVGLLPLTGMPQQEIVNTVMADDNQKATTCTSAPGGQDAVVNFQLPATADVTVTWAQLGNHVLAIYPDGGSLLACDASPGVACFPTAGAVNGSHVFARLPMGQYHLIIDADHPGGESGVVLYISGVPSPGP